jgi:RNA polymerase sigma factor (sigma-70 family)
METHLADPELADSQAASATADDELLRSFVGDRNGEAFGELVRRHSGLVLGVCRRTLRDEHDAEEAFQATFLVLAAKAGRIRVAHTLGPWLYGVAYRIAIRAAAKRARRREAALPDDLMMIDDALQNVAECHWRRVLDDEINLLPEKYRGAVVLHYLLGRTNKEVAAELGLSERTVEGRQRRGKELLRRRLTLRKVSLPSALTALAAAQAGSSSAAAPLIEFTIQAGLSFAQGNSAACSANAVRFAQGEVLAMSSPVAPLSATLVTFALLGGAIAMAGGHDSAQGEGSLPLTTAVSALLAGDGNDATKELEFQVSGVTGDVTEILGTVDADSLKPSSTDMKQRTEAEQRILSRLESQTATFDFVEQPLSDVLQIIKEELNGEVWIDRVALDEQGMTTDMPVSVQLEGLPLKSALRLMLRNHGLAFVVKDNVLVITTMSRAAQMLEAHVYDVKAIVESAEELEALAEAIQETVRPDTWSVSGMGSGNIKTFGRNTLLLVSQTAEVHEEVDDFLEQLYRGAGKGGATEITGAVSR